MVGLPNFRSHPKSGPYAAHPLLDNSKSRLAWISTPQCIKGMAQIMDHSTIKQESSQVRMKVSFPEFERSKIVTFLLLIRQDHVDTLIDVQNDDVSVWELVLISDPRQNANCQSEMCLQIKSTLTFIYSWDHYIVYISFIIIDHFIHPLNNETINSILFRNSPPLYLVFPLVI